MPLVVPVARNLGVHAICENPRATRSSAVPSVNLVVPRGTFVRVLSKRKTRGTRCVCRHAGLLVNGHPRMTGRPLIRNPTRGRRSVGPLCGHHTSYAFDPQ